MGRPRDDSEKNGQPAQHDPPIVPEARSAFSSGGRRARVYQIRSRRVGDIDPAPVLRRRPLEPGGDDAVHSSQQQEADVRDEQESEEQPDVMKRAPGAWMPDSTEPVMRQRMEHRGGLSAKPAPGSSSQEPFQHASEDAEGESGNREEGQHRHRREDG